MNRYNAMFKPSFIALSIALSFPTLSHAQQNSSPTQPKTQQSKSADTVVVTADPLGNSVLFTPSSYLTDDELAYSKQSSLGETLNNLPGVSSSYFGPFASRPIIRGMDGDRIRILRNGMTAMDASALSQDHAVPEDPMGIDRVEVLRGPAALLYGGNAIGGVVNTINGRIPQQPIEGVSGQAETGFSGANNDRHAGVALDTGHQGFNLHLDGSSRSFQDLRIPGEAATDRFKRENPDDEHNDERNRLTNSSGRADSGSIGSSYTWEHGYVGFSYNRYSSNYGSVAEPDARLDMKQNNYNFDSEIRDLDGPFKSVKLKSSYTDYKHSEIEDGEVGTTFKNKGYDVRLEGHHANIGPLEGIIGTEISRSTFSALGEEGFIPRTRTDTEALFLLEQWKATQKLDLSFGARLDYTRLSPDARGNEQFSNSYSRSFTTPSLSAGAVYQLSDIWSWTNNLGFTERAPTFYELYANGPHGATGTYEVGNPNASKEKAYSVDSALKFNTGKHSGSIGVFYSHFSNYIGMLGTGQEQEGEDGPLPVYNYSNTKARFYGVELQSKWQLFDGDSGLYTLEVGGDYVNAEDIGNHQPLPRISPLRTRLALNWARGAWDARIALEHAAGQHRVPRDSGTDSLSTGGYNRLDSLVGYHFGVGSTQWLAFLKGNNLTNETIRYSTSVLREYSPAAKRNVEVGVQVKF